MSNPFTGNKQADMLILQEVDDRELNVICQSGNRYVNSLCSDQTFYINRAVKRLGYPIQQLRVLKGSYSWKELYYALARNSEDDTMRAIEKRNFELFKILSPYHATEYKYFEKAAKTGATDILNYLTLRKGIDYIPNEYYGMSQDGDEETLDWLEKNEIIDLNSVLSYNETVNNDLNLFRYYLSQADRDEAGELIDGFREREEDGDIIKFKKEKIDLIRQKLKK